MLATLLLVLAGQCTDPVTHRFVKCPEAVGVEAEQLPLPEPEEGEDVSYDFYTWGRYGGGDTKGSVRGGGGLYVTGPVALDGLGDIQLGTGLAIESRPDTGAFSLTSLGTWGNYFEVRGHLAYSAGEVFRPSGRIRTYLIVWGGHTFDSFGVDGEQRKGLAHYAGGLKFEHLKKTGEYSSIQVGYGTDGAVSLEQFRDVLIEGAVHVKGISYIDARGAFGVGNRPSYFTAGVRLMLGDLLKEGK